MKQGSIQKTLEESTVTPEQIDQINTYTRRTLTKEEVFVFSVVLCDNEIDRDYERFTDQSLETLAQLFLGKTGIFDHVARTENQAARIFQTEAVSTDQSNSLGKPYRQLRALAYMVRCEKNETLLLEIDAGIKKEISVGCSVAKIHCSICGNEQKSNPCQHRKGQEYSGILCHYLLEEPIDAYEWSFVAIPAQKNAGVTKRYGEVTLQSGLLSRLAKSSDTVTLTKSEVFSLRQYLDQLDTLAEQGQQYMDTLCKEVVRYASISQPTLDSAVLEQVARKMSLGELTSFHASYKTAAQKQRMPSPQLGSILPKSAPKDTEFKI